jgi:hypothetical protein
VIILKKQTVLLASLPQPSRGQKRIARFKNDYGVDKYGTFFLAGWDLKLAG